MTMADGNGITIGVTLRHIRDKGGITVYTVNILQRMLQQDQRNRYIFFLPADECRGMFGRHANLEEVVVPAGGGPGAKLIWDQHRLLQAVNARHVDVLFNPKLSVPLLARCKTVFTMHGLEQFAARHLFPWLDRAYFTTAMRFYCRKADAILCMTEAGKEALQHFLGADPARIHVIPESYNERCRVIRDEAELARLREKYKLPDRYLLFVGGVTPLKNLPALIRAFHRLRPANPGLKLVLAGFRRWKHEKDMSLVSGLGIQDDVMEIGFVGDDEVAGIYNMASAFILPSFYEGFGIPILEAQACGCPAVLSNPPPMQQVAGKGALFFDPNRFEELADRLQSVLSDSALRARLIADGLENAKKYSWQKTAERTIQLFESLARP